jgi:hypothetical protein
MAKNKIKSGDITNSDISYCSKTYFDPKGASPGAEENI